MKPKFSLASLLVATALLLVGCNYDVPLTARPTRNVDARLLGVWLGGDDGKGTLVVRQLDEGTYVVAMDHDLYTAFHSDFAGTAFLSVQELNHDRLHTYLTATLSADGRQLTVRTVSTKVVPESTKGRAALQKLISANLANPALYGEPAVFTRKK
ncbi:MAG: hypothetical protein HYX71_05095 [Opitutae bacterium]|nr:hypothetical protein [Opitutae bacterium]